MKKVVSLLGVIVLMFTLLAGCGSQQAGGDAAGEEMEDIKLSYFASPSWAPVFVAREEGFFEEQGLNVELFTPGGPKGFQALQAGDCDFANLSMEPALVAAEKGMETTFFASVVKSRSYGLVTSGDITDISQLKGKVVYGTNAGSGPYVFVCDVLRQAGLDPEKDVTFVNVDQNSALIALEEGEIDATFIEMYMESETEGKDMNILVDTRKEEDCEKYLGNADFPVEGVCTTKAYAQENPETVQKFVNALEKAYQWMDSHTDEEIAESILPIFEGIDQDRLTAWMESLRGTFSVNGYISEEGYASVIQTNINAGLIQEEVPYDELVDMSYVEAATE